MTSNKIDSRITQLIVSVSAFLLVYVALFSVKHYADSESMNHYFIVESVFTNPVMALDHWGKPLFIALSCLFSFFGDRGVMIFNVLVMILSALISFKLSRKLGAKYSFIAPVLLLFAPVYYPFAQSCLTEPLFGLVAIYSALLFANKRYTFAAIVISFIIYSRSEGILFLPIYFMALLLKNEWKPLPFLGVGFLSYSLFGALLGKGFLWYFYDYPYSSIVSFYGTGPFWNWFIHYESIVGLPFAILIVVSFVLLTFQTLLKLRNSLNSQNLVLIYLITVPAAIYIFGHSFLWYKGWSASVGLPRIVGGVLPLIAVFTTVSTNKLLSYVPFFWFKKRGHFLAIILFACWMVIFTFSGKKSVILSQPNDMNKLINESIDWLENEGYPKGKESVVVYKTDYLVHFGVNPKKEEKSFLKTNIHRRTQPEKELESGDLIVWDGQTTPNEGGISFLSLDTNSHFEKLATFYPPVNFKVLGGGNYFIVIFKRK